MIKDFKKQFDIISRGAVDILPEGDFEKRLKAIIENGKYIQILENYYGKGNIPPEYQPIFQTLGVQYFWFLAVSYG